MAIYIVKPQQNLFDVALHLYGSIEGLYDILISNPEISMTTDLQAGQKLVYHEGFVINKSIVDRLTKTNTFPSNGERRIYPKITEAPLSIVVAINYDSQVATMKCKGEGEMQIDWDDNSELQTITLTPETKTIQHFFDNAADQRRVKIYGDCEFYQADFSDMNGVVLGIRPLFVEQLIIRNSMVDAAGISIFSGLSSVDLSGSYVTSLLPLGQATALQELRMENSTLANTTVLDEYLEYLAGSVTHGTRLPGKIFLTNELTERGKAAIDTILGDPEWNTSEPWEFYINDTLYTLANGTDTE